MYIFNYVPQTKFGRHIVFAPFLIILIIILLLSFFRQKFVRHISRRCLDQTWWHLVGISYAMWSCAFKGWFFRNGCRCHGNGQNAKKMKNIKMIITGYSPNSNQYFYIVFKCYFWFLINESLICIWFSFFIVDVPREYIYVHAFYLFWCF